MGYKKGTNPVFQIQPEPEILNQLSDQDAQITTLVHGLSAITTDQATPTDIKMYGRTLVNLLGNDGNCEDLSKFIAVNSPTVSLDNANKVYGSNSIKIAVGSGQTYGILKKEPTIDASKCYLVTAMIKNGNATRGYLKLEGTSSFISQYVTDTSNFKLAYRKIAPASITSPSLTIEIAVEGSGGQYLYVDGISLYEIPQSIYDKIDVDPAYTGDALADKFPYVDSVQHVMNPYVKNSGKNLIPSFTSGKWTLHANAKVVSDYELELDSTAVSQFSSVSIPVLVNQQYVYSAPSTGSDGSVQIIYLDKSGNQIGSSIYVTSDNNGYVLITPSTVSQVKISFYGSTPGTFIFTNPQLELGSTATPFVPQNESYLYVAQDADKNPILLASNNDGSVADEVYQRDNQWYRLNRWDKDVMLDGSLGWVFSADFTGYKKVSYTTFLAQNASNLPHTLVKFNGNISNDYENGDGAYVGSNNLFLYITVPDTDTGWGETYTPTADEIKAYFYGWRMNNGTFGTAYDGTGTKTWVPIGDIDNTRATTVLPTADAPTIAEGKIDHYKLTYQLANATEEAIEVEGSLDLIDGGNQIEIGEVVVVREKVTPKPDIGGGTKSYINLNAYSGHWDSSALSKRVDKFINVYKNGELDEGWVLGNSSYQNGNSYLSKPTSQVDSTAEYTVTYIALDTYKLSAAENKVEVEYSTNIKTVVDELVQQLEDDETDISVLKILMIDVLARLQNGGL